ncbi:hypothetical protein AOLI_G00282500 [Acnodon oligacanthus]
MSRASEPDLGVTEETQAGWTAGCVWGACSGKGRHCGKSTRETDALGDPDVHEDASLASAIDPQVGPRRTWPWWRERRSNRPPSRKTQPLPPRVVLSLEAGETTTEAKRGDESDQRRRRARRGYRELSVEKTVTAERL